ncbi:MAG TPA: FliA/WhiG family RNA polymerase sigma factor [Opitutales bacterium]|nr:FliA/WhiG family RNA polymerase sigma factor [Opitutales bacterium]
MSIVKIDLNLRTVYPHTHHTRASCSKRTATRVPTLVPLPIHLSRLIEQYLPLVDQVVRSLLPHFPAHADPDELHSLGVLGLIDAVRKFDPKQKATFIGYAQLRIRGSILDELRKQDCMPRTARAKTRRLQSAVETLEQRLGRAPTREELCKALSLSAEGLERFERQATPPSFVSLQAGMLCAPNNDLRLEEAIADDAQLPCSELLERKELNHMLADHILTLNERQRKILALYYYEGLKLSEIAQVFGVSEARICQIHLQTLTKLKRQLQGIVDYGHSQPAKATTTPALQPLRRACGVA